jgi:hypothetical protein
MLQTLLVSIALLSVLMTSTAWAQLANGRALAGLEEIGVVVAEVHPDAAQRGLSRGALQLSVEKQLQDAGMHIATGLNGKGREKPLLYLAVGITPLDQFPVYSVNVSLQLRQSACLERNLVICTPTVTWEETGMARAVDVAELTSVQRDVQSLVKRFTTAYHAENQR